MDKKEKTLVAKLEEYAEENGISCVWLDDANPKYIPVSFPEDRAVFMNSNWEYQELNLFTLAYEIECVLHKSSSVKELNAYAEELIQAI